MPTLADVRHTLLDLLPGGYRRRLTRLARPDHYKESYVRRALACYTDPTYLEIGVRDGESFRLARAHRKLGIDPVAWPELRQLKPGEEFYELTSDEFFAERAPEVLERASVDVALIDGLHEFRQVVRDLLNLAPYMRPDGVVFLDDMNPLSRETAAENPPGDIDVPEGGVRWNGDVWKIAPLITRALPELTIRTVDADNGVGIVGGLALAHADGLGAEIDRCKALDYSELESSRTAMLHLIAPADFAATLSSIRAPSV